MASKLMLVGLNLVLLLCWGVMFLAGNDVWHEADRPDIWNLAGPPYVDLRAALYAFYLQFLLLLAQLVLLLTQIGLRGWHFLRPARSAG